MEKIQKLVSLVKYQTNSVVSKTLINKPAGTVTLFAFDQGEGLSEHRAPFDAIVNILDGEAEIKIDGEPRIVRAGEMIIMPADHPHSLSAIKKFKMLLIMIKEKDR